MPTFDETLKKIYEVNDFLRQCPESCREAALRMVRDEFPNPEPAERGEALASLRWLHLAQMLQKTDPRHPKYQEYLTVINTSNLTLDGFMEGFRTSHRSVFNGKTINPDTIKAIDLDALIIEQQRKLYSYFLLQEISGALNTGYRFFNNEFDAILVEALRFYKRCMIDATLHQFNIIRLIELEYQYPSYRGSIGKMIDGLRHAPPFILSFTKMEALSRELPDILDTDYNEAGILKCLEDETSIYKELEFKATTSLTLGDTKMGESHEFFNSDQHTSLVKQLSRVMGDMNDLPKEGSKGKPSPFFRQDTPEPTLNELRQVIDNYAGLLSNITVDEKAHYSKRKEDHLQKREQAVHMLLMSVNREKKLTPPLKHLVFKLVEEIQTNQPTWKERSFLTKMLDILCLGLPALYRYGTFKRTDAETKLLQTAKIYPKNMKELDAIPSDPQKKTEAARKEPDSHSVDSVDSVVSNGAQKR